MTPPRIIVRYFSTTPNDIWARFVRVLASTAREQCPDWTLDIETVPPTDLTSPLGAQGHVHNTRKLDAWVAAVDEAADGERLLLLDADIAILRPLDPIWAQAFDLAYTVKPVTARTPFNGGVVFLRVSPSTRLFLRMWSRANRFLLDHPKHLDVWSPAFVGLNQSSLGLLLSSAGATWRASADWPSDLAGYRHGLSLLRVPCLEWNCEDEHWEAFDPAVTRVLHLKGALHQAILRRPHGPVPRGLVDLWRTLEQQAMRGEERDTFWLGTDSPETSDERLDRPERNMMVTPDELTNRETSDTGTAERTPPPPTARRARRSRRGIVPEPAGGA